METYVSKYKEIIGKTYFSSCDNCVSNYCSAPMVMLAPLI